MLFSIFWDEFTVEDHKDSQRMDAIGEIGVPFKVLAHIPSSWDGLKDNFAHPNYKQTSLFGVIPVDICAYTHSGDATSVLKGVSFIELYWICH